MFASLFYHEQLYVSKCILYVIIDAMITQSETIQDSLVRTAVPWLEGTNTVLFDIETTGLSPRRSHLYLIGAVGFIRGQWTLRQWLAQKPSEEPALLRAFDDFLSVTGAEVLVHYNGDSFDLPYLRSKYAFYGMACPDGSLQSLDLYRLLRPYRKILGLSSLKQKDAENCVGLNRMDTMSGAELIGVYQDYLRTVSPSGLRLLLLHNHDDLLGLAGILPLLALRGLFEGEFQAGRTVPAEGAAEIRLSLSKPLPVSLNLSSDLCRLQADKDAGSALLLPVCRQGVLLHFFPDYKNYYYLPAEDQAIHKSVAAFVDRGHRTRATAATCYQKASGLFLPQPAEIITPVFRRSYDDRTLWFRLDQENPPGPEQMHAYARAMLQTFI